MLKKRLMSLFLSMSILLCSFYTGMGFKSYAAGLYNGDFEQGTLEGWRNDGGENSMGVVPGAYLAGNYMGQSEREADAAADNFWGMTYSFDVEAGKNYDFSVAMKSQNARTAVIKIDWRRGPDDYVQTDYILGETDGSLLTAWSDYKSTFTAPAGAVVADLRVLYKVGATDKAIVWADDALCSVHTEAPPVINNGDFERGTLEGWRNDGGDNSLSVIPGAYSTGNYVGQSEREADPAADNFWGMAYSFTVEAGKKYDFSIAMKTQNARTAVIKIDWRKGPNDYVQTDYILGETDGSQLTEWAGYKGSFTAPAGAVVADLRVLYKVGVTDKAIVWADNASCITHSDVPSNIINGNFEMGDLSYWNMYGDDSSASAVTDEIKNSLVGNSTRNGSSTTGGDWWGLSYKVCVESGSQYFFSADVKTENTNDAHIKIDWIDENGNDFGNTFIRGGLTGNIDWDTYVGTITVPDNAKFAEIKFLQGRPAEDTTAVLSVDNVKFEKPQSANNALPNGNFEDGSLSNWITYGENSAEAVPGAYNTGSYVGKSSRTSEQKEPEYFGMGYLAYVAPYSVYKFSAGLKTETAKDAYVKLDWFDSAGNTLLTNQVSENIQGTNDWKLFENDFTAPLKASYVVISFLQGCPDSGTGNIYIDNLEFYSEPLENGDFENNSLYKWEVSGNAHTVSGSYKTGEYMAVSEREAADQKPYWSGLNYYASVDPAMKYEFSSAIKTENACEAHIKITWLDEGKNPLKNPENPSKDMTEYLLETPLNGDNDWNLISDYFTPPSGAKYALIGFCHQNPKSGTGKMYIDNVYFKEYTAQEATKHFKDSGGKAKVLFTASPSGAFGANFPALDDQYAIELYNQNYTAKETNYYYTGSLDKTNVLSYGVTYPDRLPFVTDKYDLYEDKNPTVEELKQYVSNGGGLLLNMGYVGYGDQQKVVDNINSFLNNFGAELAWDKVTDEEHKEIFDYSAKYTYYSTGNIASTELTNGISKIWYPGGKDTYSVTAYSIKSMDNNWTVDIKAEDTAKPQYDGSAPVLMAHRTYGKGRIVVLTMDPRFGVASGSHEAYGGYILSDQVNDKKLYRNIYDWLGEPSINDGRVFKKATTEPEVATPKAVKPSIEYTDEELQAKLNDPSNPMVNLNQYKGIIGVQSNLSGGTDSIENMYKAAKEKGYNFLVFAEDYTKMTEEKYNDLVSRCNAINGADADFSAIPGLLLPQADKDIEPRYYGKGKRVVFNLKRWPTVQEATSPEWYTLLFNHSWPSVIVSEPNLNTNSPWQLMFYTGLAIDTYSGNTRMDEASDLYRSLVTSDYRLIPVAVSYIDSAAGLSAYDGAVTHVYSKNINEIKDNIKTFGGSGTSYTSTGPTIGFKYASAASATYAGSGEEIFTNQKFALDIAANSEAKLEKVVLYRDKEVYRTYYPDSNGFHKTLFLTKDANHAFTVEVTDVNGKRAVSNSIRTGSPYHNFTMCTDKQNVIHNFYGKEGSDGIIQSFWLSGKDLGQLYINKSSFDIAPAGEDASWAAVSVVESMPKVWTKNSPLGGDDPAVSTVNPREVRLSTDDAVVVDSTIQDEVFEGYTRYTTFRPQLKGDNILMVEGNYTTKKEVTMGDTKNNLEMILFRIMGNYAHESFKTYVYSPDYNTKITGTMNEPATDTGDAFIPVQGDFKLSEGGYLGMWASKTGNIMLFPMGSETHDLSFGLTTSRRVFEESGSEKFRNYLALGYSDPGKTIPANTPIKYKLLFVIDNGNTSDSSHADEIRSAYRLGTSQGIQADIANGSIADNRYALTVKAEKGYAAMKLDRRYMPNGVLPVIVKDTNTSWDAVEYDYDRQSFRKLYGFEGDLYSAVDINSNRNLFIGNPFLSSEKKLKINILKDNSGKIQLEVHNSSDETVEATIENSKGLENVVSIQYEGSWAPGETKILTPESKICYSFECEGPVNAALEAPVTTDSTDGDNASSLAVDGLNGTKWKSADTEGQHWLEADLGKEYKIDRFIIKHAGAGMEDEKLNTSDFNVQYRSPETGEWLNAATVEGNTKNITVCDIKAIKARVVRLLISKANSTADDHSARICGFEVYPTYVETTGSSFVQKPL